ncbi:MAG: MipA/OmpV family protein [Rhodoferax sp.]|nr:MipA/OmpV family protein [Rhodoferax sp.]MCF8210391.1 MipA/OmpV family protein [Rhodoferax sp.]
MSSSSKNFPLLVFALSFASLASAQFSDEGDFQGPDHAREGGRVSLWVSSKADYSGSDAPRVAVMPALEYQWANGWFAGTNRGVGYNFSKDPTLQYGLGLGVDFGRKESVTGALAGMGSMDAKVEYGAFLNYAPDRHWRLSSVLRYGSGDTGEGATANFGANYAMDIAPQWRLDLGVATTWANSQSMQSYFGVNATQSQQSGHAVYSPAAGLRDVSYSLNLSYQITPKISVSGGIKATSLVGDARNSPIVTSPQSVSGSLSVGYAF